MLLASGRFCKIFRSLAIDKLLFKYCIIKVFRLPWESNLLLSCFWLSAVYSHKLKQLTQPVGLASLNCGTGTVLYGRNFEFFYWQLFFEIKWQCLQIKKNNLKFYGLFDFLNWTHKNIPNRQHSGRFLKLLKVLITPPNCTVSKMPFVSYIWIHKI